MTPLGREISAIIAAEGPLPVSRFMALCLGHPRHGYYMTRDPFGADGDFTTAPEISQVFAELLGAWACAVWTAMGRPARVNLVELGPGRGTLMRDALRAIAAWPDFAAGVSVHLVESSPFLSRVQQETLSACGHAPRWHLTLADVPDGPAIILANELMDALPIRQFERAGGAWRERVVGLGDDGGFRLGLAPDPLSDLLLPPALRQAEEGAVAEICPSGADLIAQIGGRATLSPTVALFIDYGHTASAHGDTLQAVKRHAFVDPLAEPGEADVTAHVDFAEMVRLARVNGLVPSQLLSQRELLFRLGLVERAEALARSNPARLSALREGVERLIDPAPTGMGAMFKALALASPETSVPAFDIGG